MVLFLVLLGCAGDADGDGVPDAKDCVPDNGAISSAAAEVCNGVDDDCDGVVDQGLATTRWYRDRDGDGFGAEAREACAAPAGWVAEGGDCDDGARWVYPGAIEICDGVDQDCDSAVDEDAADVAGWYLDADGDGYGADDTWEVGCDRPSGTVTLGGDCDDADPTLSPEAQERCGGGDEDCDGLVDGDDPDVEEHPTAAGAVSGYRDADGDGWGAEAGGYCAGAAEGWTDRTGDCDDTDATTWPGAPPVCDEPVDHDCDGRPDDWDADGDGFTACDDCDDGDPAVNVGAPELCNGVDDDCDGTADEDAVDVLTFYQDADGDGYGTAALSVEACAAPRGYAETSTDCDDTVERVNPGQPENCRTAADDNCDGLTDEIDATGCTDWYTDTDGDGYGVTGESLCQCEAPGEPYVATASGDCATDDATIHPFAADPCSDGLDADCDGDDACATDDLPLLAVGHDGQAYAGFTLTSDVDVTGDGIADLVAGTWGLDTDTSAALVYAGPVGTTQLPLTAALFGVSTDNRIGLRTTAGDADGDGVGDILTGDRNGEYGGVSDSGVVYLFTGPILTSTDTRSATLALYGQRSDGLGWGATLGDDVDADGAPDVVAAGLLGSYGGYCGWPGTWSGAYTIADAAWCVNGDAGTGILGHAVDTGDVNGDGVADLVYGMYSVGDGAVAWMEGPISGTISATGWDGGYELDARGEYTFGTRLRILADIDEDGLADLAAASDESTWYFGSARPGWTGTTAGAAARVTETPSYDEETPALGVDLDADGRMELLVGAPDVADGRALLYAAPVTGTLGPMDALLAYEGGGVGGAFGALPDVDGDGRDDVAVGAAWWNGGTPSWSGAVFLLPGSELP